MCVCGFDCLLVFCLSVRLSVRLCLCACVSWARLCNGLLGMCRVHVWVCAHACLGRTRSNCSSCVFRVRSGSSNPALASLLMFSVPRPALSEMMQAQVTFTCISWSDSVPAQVSLVLADGHGVAHGAVGAESSDLASSWFSMPIHAPLRMCFASPSVHAHHGPCFPAPH